MSDSPTLTFLGGAGTVTGSKFLVQLPSGSAVLVDCGLFQGRKELRLRNWAPFEVDPVGIDAVALTHAHIDHCGALPRLVTEGFTGPVFATHNTVELARIVLPDSGHLHEEEAADANRMGYSKHHPALPLYTEADARRALDHLRTVRFHEPVELAPGVIGTWHHAGHILGAATIELHMPEFGCRVMFSGDLGRPDHPLLRPPDPIADADVVVCESTYGDTRRPPEAGAGSAVHELLGEVISDTARRGGVVIIPAFAVDRTEIILHHLDALTRAGDIPQLPVFVDSPMASAALEVYRRAARAGSTELRAELRGQELFAAVQLSETRTVEESKAITNRHGPMVVISASGMATGGRVLHHLAARLGDDRNAIVLVGFQAPGTRGDRLASGAPTVKLLGADRPVAARVHTLAVSAHADQGELTDWLRTADRPPGQVLLVHGEPPASAALAAHLEAQIGASIQIPDQGDAITVQSRP